MSSNTKKPPRDAEPVDALNQTWWLSKITGAMRRRFAAPIRARARQALLEDKSVMSEDEFDEAAEFFQSRIDSGAYEWGPPVELGGIGPGKAVLAAIQTTTGQVQLLQIVLEETHGPVSTSQAVDILNDNPDGVAAAIRAAMGLPPLPTAPPEQAATGETTTKTETPAADPTAVA